MGDTGECAKCGADNIYTSISDDNTVWKLLCKKCKNPLSPAQEQECEKGNKNPIKKYLKCPKCSGNDTEYIGNFDDGNGCVSDYRPLYYCNNCKKWFARDGRIFSHYPRAPPGFPGPPKPKYKILLDKLKHIFLFPKYKKEQKKWEKAMEQANKSVEENKKQYEDQIKKAKERTQQELENTDKIKKQGE